MEKRNVIGALDVSTKQMYEQINMKEIKCVLVRNNLVDQYTSYNFPVAPKVTDREKLWLKRFESLHEQYLSSGVKKNFILSEQYEVSEDFSNG